MVGQATAHCKEVDERLQEVFVSSKENPALLDWAGADAGRRRKSTLGN
jgi:hypothetical protein